MKNLIFMFFASMLLFCSCDRLDTAVGGYSKTRRISDSEKELFTTLTASIEGVEYRPMNVATQVVAGTNYRFLCKAREVENGKKGDKYYAVVVIHKPLPHQGEPRIIEIERQKR